MQKKDQHTDLQFIMRILRGVKSEKGFVRVALCLCVLLTIGASQAWANSVTSANSGDDVSGGNIVMQGAHATFTFSGATSIYYYGSDGYALASDFGKGRRNYSFTWAATHNGYDVQVTRIAFWSKAYHWVSWKHGQGKVEFDGGSGVEVGTAALTSNSGDYAKFDKSSSFSSGVPFVCVSEGPDFDFYIKNITIEYTIAPHALAASDATIYVTKDDADKQTIDIRSLFTATAGAPDDFEYAYELIDTENAHLEGDNIFWTSVAGDYRVRARVNAAGDHAASAWTTATIHVRKWPNTLYAAGSASYSPTMLLESTLTGVTLTASNTDYATYPIACTQVQGADTLLYNRATGEVTSGSVLGVGRWHLTQPESPYYLAGDNYFTVTIVNGTYIFYNTTGDEQWETAANWDGGILPGVNDNVRVKGNLSVDEEHAMYHLSIEDAAVVRIMPNGGMTIGAGGVIGATKDNLVLRAQTTGADRGRTGYLRISPSFAGAMPEATVEMYSKAYYNTAAHDPKWQYIGTPLDEPSLAAKNVFTQSYLYSWDEAKGDWVNQLRTLVMEPFKGYITTQRKNADGLVITYAGHLVSGRTPVDVPLSYTAGSPEAGCNVLANSFAAPIDISQFNASDFSDGVTATIYLFNTGSQSDIELRESQKAVNIAADGQYIAIPIGSATQLHNELGYPIVIPSMQGFYVETEKNGTLTLDYERLVWNANYSDGRNTPLRVQARNQKEDNDLTGALQVTLSANNSIDHLYMLAADNYSREYENGYDAPKKMSDDTALPCVFAAEDDRQMSVDATEELAGTHIGVYTGEEEVFTLTFSHVKTDTELVLIDNETGETIDITEEAEYTFQAAPYTTISERFVLGERSGSQSSVTTDCGEVNTENKVQKYIYNNQLFILKSGVRYNAQGMRVR